MPVNRASPTTTLSDDLDDRWVSVSLQFTFAPFTTFSKIQCDASVLDAMFHEVEAYMLARMEKDAAGQSSPDPTVKAELFSAGEAGSSNHHIRSGSENTAHPLQSVDPDFFTASTSTTRDVIAESPRLPPYYCLKAPAHAPSSPSRPEAIPLEFSRASSSRSRNHSKIFITLGCSQAKAVEQTTASQNHQPLKRSTTASTREPHIESKKKQRKTTLR